MIQLTEKEEYWLKLFAKNNDFFESIKQYYNKHKYISKKQFQYLLNQIKQTETTVELKSNDAKAANSKENLQNAVKFLQSLLELLLHEKPGFKTSASIDLNQSINLLEYETNNLPYAKDYKAQASIKDILKINDNRKTVIVRHMLKDLKKEGIKYGKQPIPIYQDGKKKKLNFEYFWIIQNIQFLKDIFEIRLSNYDKKLHRIKVQKSTENPNKIIEEKPALLENDYQKNLLEYQKYLDAIWVKTNKRYKIYEASNCPYCYKEILKDSEFCSFCGCKIEEHN